VSEDAAHPERTALEGIASLRDFFVSSGMPRTLSELKIPCDRIGEMAAKATGDGAYTLGEFVKLDTKAVTAILESCR
jgi:alcohol dehydrogenase YqhD (iron-dependent ADH family)